MVQFVPRLRAVLIETVAHLPGGAAQVGNRVPTRHLHEGRLTHLASRGAAADGRGIQFLHDHRRRVDPERAIGDRRRDDRVARRK